MLLVNEISTVPQSCAKGHALIDVGTQQCSESA